MTSQALPFLFIALFWLIGMYWALCRYERNLEK